MTSDRDLRRLAEHFNLVARAIHDADETGHAAPVLAFCGDAEDVIITVATPEGAPLDDVLATIIRNLAWPTGLHTLVIGAEAWMTAALDEHDGRRLGSLADSDPRIRTAIFTTAVDLRSLDGYTHVGIARLDDHGRPTWDDAEADNALSDEAIREFHHASVEPWTTDDGSPMILSETERAMLVDSMLHTLAPAIGAAARFAPGALLSGVVG